MSIHGKFLLWLAGIGGYVVLLGGVFYYQLFKWTFDERLKQDLVGSVGVHAPGLINGLLGSPAAITFGEYDIMNAINKDERVAGAVYVGRNNKIRWHKDSRFMDMPFDKYSAQVPVPTSALTEAVMSRKVVARQVPGGPFYEIAIPFTLRGEVIGVMDLTVSRAKSRQLIGSAMWKYAVGALGVILLLGVPLYYFFTHYVIAPIEALREKVRYVSVRSPELKFPPRGDEIGALAGDITAMVDKMRGELEEHSRRAGRAGESEELWWRALLGQTVQEGAYAVVVNQDNNVLYSNFDLGRPAQTVHLLDIVDNRQQDMLRLIGEALENPGTPVVRDTTFREKDVTVKVLSVGSAPETARTLILLSPRATQPENLG